MHTLVLVPGLLSDERVWAPLAKSLSGKMSIHHANVKEAPSISSMAESILNKTVGPLVVVGHSMGGRVAMEITAQAPDRVVGLVLADTGSHPLKEGEEKKRQDAIDLGYKSMKELCNEWLPPMVYEKLHSDTTLMGPLEEMVLSFDPETHERQIRALIGRPNAQEYISSFSCPTLLLTGQFDTWAPAPQHLAIAEQIEDSEFVQIANAGHFAPIEAPTDINNVVGEWLTRKLDI